VQKYKKPEKPKQFSEFLILKIIKTHQATSAIQPLGKIKRFAK